MIAKSSLGSFSLVIAPQVVLVVHFPFYSCTLLPLQGLALQLISDLELQENLLAHSIAGERFLATTVQRDCIEGMAYQLLVLSFTKPPTLDCMILRVNH